MLLAAAVTLSIVPPSLTAAATFALAATGVVDAAGAVTRMLLNSGFPTNVISLASPKFSTVGLSNTCTKSVLPKYSYANARNIKSTMDVVVLIFG